MLGISKRGDSYLRTLLIHGARSVQRVSVNKTDPRSRWLNAVSTRRHKNVGAVALANKNARIAWAVLSSGEAYRSEASRAESAAVSDVLSTGPVLPTAANGSLA